MVHVPFGVANRALGARVVEHPVSLAELDNTTE
jgi:hypothetical protein